MRPISPWFLSTVLLAGCALGPQYDRPPESSTATGFARAGDATLASEPRSTWWQALGDATLDDLMQRALAANIDLDVATARLQQARAGFRLEHANGLPSVGGSALYARARLPHVDLGRVIGNDDGNTVSTDRSATQLDLYSVGFDASWEIDLFGGRQRAVESARATAEAAAARLQDVQVSLTADVANAYVSLRDTQRRLALAQKSIEMQDRMLVLTHQRVDRGTATRLDIVRLDDQLERARADWQVLDADRESYLNQIAVLLGEQPGAEDQRLTTASVLPLPPAQVAVGDPASLLRRRPDVRAAERTLAADTAKIGQAEAAKYPSLKLFGVIGIGGTRISDLSHLDDFSTVLAPMLSWNFADFGRNDARVGQAEQVRNEAEARYRGTVLAALRDAEDSLSRFRHGRMTVASRARSKDSADQAVMLLSQRYEAGTVTLIDVLDATRQQITAEQGLSQAEADLTRSFVAIQKALGLGWSS